jgi:hypothetical protein
VTWALGSVRFQQDVVDSMPGIEVPMIQELVQGRDRPVYHLCGYLSSSGSSAVLAHRKLLQVPRRFGGGIAFETAPVDTVLAEQLLNLLQSTGFHGMFEAEFVSPSGRHLLIDLNIRTYNGLRLEAERGLNLAWYAYLEAAGENDRLGEELAAAPAAADAEVVYCRKLEFAATLGGQFMGGGFGVTDVARWARWYCRNRGRMVDPWMVRGDRRAGRARLFNQLNQWRRSPRVFLGVYFRPESSV